MIDLIKRLTGNELKVLCALLTQCDEDYAYTPIENLTDFELTHPTVHKVVDRLKELQIVEQYDFGNRSILKLKPKYHRLSYYLKNYSFQTELINDSIENIQKKIENTIPRKDICRLIYYYGQKRGVSEERLQDWFKINIARLTKSAKTILTYLKDVEKAFVLVDNTKLYYESRNLSWTMEGVMVREMDKLSNLTLAKKDGAGNWF